MRINKFLAESGHCSRRQADDLIKAGQVFINGKKVELGSQVNKNDEVRVNNQIIDYSPKKIYIVYNKPVGVICTTDESKKDNIINKININERIFPVGRLDVESSGLILLTNDGDWANRVSHPKYEHDKEYLVETDRSVSVQAIKQLKKGIKLTEGLAKADSVKQASAQIIHITIHQGWNRQIRRMVEAVGLKVKKLTRVRINNILLGNLKAGEWRELDKKEISTF